MALKIGVFDFRDAINDILTEYGDAAKEAVELACRDTAKQAVKALRSAGTFKGGEEYRRGWTYKIELTRLGATAIVYNKAKPGLSHLLEFGHAIAGGGRTKPRTEAFNFIAPVDEKVGDEMLENIDKRLGG